MQRRSPTSIDPRAHAAARGDRRAQAELVRELSPRVRSLVRHLVRGRSEVDDIAQKALLAVLRGLPSYRGDGTLASWSDRITTRATFAHLERERAELRGRDTREPLELFAVPSPALRPDERLLHREVLGALEALPAEQRDAVVLHHVVGLSVPELAAELDVPAETARSRIRLGMKKLRERLGPPRAAAPAGRGAPDEGAA